MQSRIERGGPALMHTLGRTSALPAFSVQASILAGHFWQASGVLDLDGVDQSCVCGECQCVDAWGNAALPMEGLDAEVAAVCRSLQPMPLAVPCSPERNGRHSR